MDAVSPPEEADYEGMDTDEACAPLRKKLLDNVNGSHELLESFTEGQR